MNKTPRQSGAGLRPVAYALLLLLGWLSACGGQPAEPTPIPPEAAVVTVTLTEFEVAIDREEIPIGVPVTFIVKNAGAIEHNLILEPVGAKDAPLLGPDGTPMRIDGLKSGQTTQFTFTFDEALAQANESKFQLGCHLPGHFEAGMLLQFRVGGEPP